MCPISGWADRAGRLAMPRGPLGHLSGASDPIPGKSGTPCWLPASRDPQGARGRPGSPPGEAKIDKSGYLVLQQMSPPVTQL